MRKDNGTAAIVYSGQKNSFEEKILKATIEGFKKRDKKYIIIDLYKDKFSPNFEGINLALYARGETKDKHVIKYQKILKEANELVFIYEILWQGADAMFKGFLDKVFLSNGFWHVKKVAYFDALWGDCQWLKRTMIFAGSLEGKKDIKYFGKSGITSMKLGTLMALKLNRRKMMIHPEKDKSEELGIKFLEQVKRKAAKKL